MAYEVLARKWRPQQFDGVVGQQHVTQTLKNAIRNDRVAHAYLLVGPRGVGKTSTARIFAKALNCRKGPTPEPCDACESCREIMAGSGLDVLEIDAASHTGVDNVRDLRENAQYTPARGPYKVYIIDEVHMLSPGAFNALLKTLEEPPPHVKFIFATTEPQKMPATILSRCQRFDLRRISSPDIVKRLEEIAATEQLEADADALLAIARGAEGGLRDAESALDQLIAFCGRKITENDVLSVFGLVARHTLEDLARALLEGDVPKAIGLVGELDEAGKDIQRVALELLEHFRNLLISQYAGDSGAGLELTEAQAVVIRAQKDLAPPGRVLKIAEILTEAENRMRYALSRRTVLEMAVIRCARAAKMISLDELVARLEQLRSAPGAAAEDVSGPSAPEEPALFPENGGQAPEEPEPARAAAPAADASADEVNMLISRWHEIVERVARQATLAKAYLPDAKPVRVGERSVVIGFDPEFAANRKNIDFPRNRQALQTVLSDVLGRQVQVEFSVLDAKSTLPGDMKIPPAKGATEGAAGGSAEPASLQKRQEWVREPKVRMTLEAFGGDIVDVRE